MALAAASFAVLVNLVRWASAGLPVFEIAFFRNLFGLLVMLPWLVRRGRTALATRRPGLVLLRGVLALAAMLGWFATLAAMPLVEATALSFLAPVFASALAIPLLGEPPSARRFLALALAFAGALTILRPTAAALHPAAPLALATALIWGLATVVVKRLTQTENPAALVTWMVLFTTPASLLLALPVWRTPTPEELAGLALLGAAGSLGHYALTRALASADAGAVAPFDYLRLPFVALFAWLAFGEGADAVTWLGSALIAAGGLVVLRGEAATGRPAP